MGLIALAVALLIEQLRPLRPDNRPHRFARELVDLARQHSRTDRPFDAVIAWFAVVAGGIVLVLLLQWIAAAIGSLASFLLHVAILYLTVGFRQFGHNLAAMLVALGRDEPARAGQVLDDWIAAGEGRVAPPGPAADATTDLPGRVWLCRRAITHALMNSHRELFAPILAYLLLPGAIGPVVYRIVDLLARRWSEPAPADFDTVIGDFDGVDELPADDEGLAYPSMGGTAADVVHDAHAGVAARGMHIVDWIPLRVTAAGFAIAGDFEDSTYCWRAAIAAGAGHDRRAMLAAIGGGALGLDLIDPERDRYWAGNRGAGNRADGVPGSFDWTGSPPDAGGIRGTIALIWRAATLVVGLFVLASLSSWLGG